jgi:hypothetical protein
MEELDTGPYTSHDHLLRDPRRTIAFAVELGNKAHSCKGTKNPSDQSRLCICCIGEFVNRPWARLTQQIKESKIICYTYAHESTTLLNISYLVTGKQDGFLGLTDIATEVQTSSGAWRDVVNSLES